MFGWMTLSYTYSGDWSCVNLYCRSYTFFSWQSGAHPQPSLTKSFIKDHQTKLLIVFIFMRLAHMINTTYGISVLSAKLETHYSTIHNKIVY